MEDNKNLTAEQIAEMIAKAVETNSTSIYEKLAKLPSFSTEKKEEPKVSDKKKISDLVKELANGTIGKVGLYKATNVEGTDNIGGYLVPQEYNRFLPNPNDFGIARRYGTVINMSRDKMNLPYISTDVTAANISEANAITVSNYVFGNLQLDASKYAALVPMSNELLQDSLYDISGIVTTSITKQFSGAEDKLLVDRFQALATVYTASASTTGSFANAVLVSGSSVVKDLAAIPGKLQSINTSYAEGAQWIMNPTTLSSVRSLVDTTGRPLIDMQQGQPSLFGYPVLLSNKMSGSAASVPGDGIAVFGNLKNAYLGDRIGIDLMLAREGTVGSDSLLQKDMAAFRAITRFDIQLDPSAFVIYECK